MEGKPVVLRYFYNESNVPIYQPINGTFQRWGDEVRCEKDEYFAVTIAIVVGEDGKVYTVPPGAVKFV
jgi:hypothetical protein